MFHFFKKNLHKFIFIFSTILLLIGFYFNEDGTGGGAKGDFEVTYGFILALQENILSDPKDWTLADVVRADKFSERIMLEVSAQYGFQMTQEQAEKLHVYQAIH